MLMLLRCYFFATADIAFMLIFFAFLLAAFQRQAMMLLCRFQRRPILLPALPMPPFSDYAITLRFAA